MSSGIVSVEDKPDVVLGRDIAITNEIHRKIQESAAKWCNTELMLQFRRLGISIGITFCLAAIRWFWYDDLIAAIGNNLLLHGPRGMGKTLMAKMLATMAGAKFISIDVPALVQVLKPMTTASLMMSGHQWWCCWLSSDLTFLAWPQQIGLKDPIAMADIIYDATKMIPTKPRNAEKPDEPPLPRHILFLHLVDAFYQVPHEKSCNIFNCGISPLLSFIDGVTDNPHVWCVTIWCSDITNHIKLCYCSWWWLPVRPHWTG